jgi:hypothetical protein
MSKLAILAILCLPLGACASVTPSQCAEAHGRAAKAEAALGFAISATAAACGADSGEACGRARAGVRIARQAASAAEAVLAVLCPNEAAPAGG